MNGSATVVRSGCMAKDADMILSEFILLGIGGKELSEENAAQTAKALNIIQPDFIRVHATGIKLESKLGEFVRDGSFTLQSEEEIVIEQKLFLQQLHEMDSYYVNEHIVNLLLEVRGNLRTEKQEMLSTIDRFLTLPPDERLLFTVGRRLNIFFRLDDLKRLYRLYDEIEGVENSIEEVKNRLLNIQQQKISEENVYQFLLYFDKLYDKFTDLEKKEFLNSFVEQVDIYEQEQPDGRFLKHIKFRFPVYFGDRETQELCWDNESTVESCALLSKLE